MGIPRPTGPYVEQLIEPNGWPDVDEDQFYDRAHEFGRVLQDVTEVLDSCRQQRAEVFDGGLWSGRAAGSADGELRSRLNQLVTLQDRINSVITWHDRLAASIQTAKLSVAENIEAALRQIALLETNPTLEPEARTNAINAVLLTTHGTNVGVVAATAEQILASRPTAGSGDPISPPGPWITPVVADIAEADAPAVAPTPETPPGAGEPGAAPDPGVPPGDDAAPGTPDHTAPSLPGPGGDETAGLTPSTPTTPTTPGTTPDAPGTPDQAPHAPAAPSPAVLPPVSAPTAPAAGTPPGMRPPTSPDTRPGADPAAAELSDVDGVPESVTAPAATTPAGAGTDAATGMAPASAAAPPVPGVGARDDAAPAVAPAAASSGAGAGAGMPAGAVPPAAARGGGGGGAGAAGGGGSSAPVAPQRKLGAHPFSKATARPAQPAASTNDPAPAADQPERPSITNIAAAAAIPVSKKRAERDAIAAASIADAEGRPGGGPDPVRLARRIAAALNAPGSGGLNDLGFYWVTGVTADGAIVVANSYGIAYIPEGVELPEPVQMASADDSIPVIERARWATYPVAAVQGWAAHHGAALRTVIATEKQFGASDAGAAKILLTPEDIPEDGSMGGRSRLQVVDPDSAQTLSDTEDAHLAELLPPAPAGTAPPPDRKSRLWFDVMKPMASAASGRETAHLRAFRSYAALVGDLALHDAHAAAEPDRQRAAVADWLYWKYVTTTLEGLPVEKA